MHKELVEERRWIGEQRFLHALNYCMLLPGPEAQQLAIYIGWLLHKTVGGLVAGILFVVPGALVMFVLSSLYALYGDVPLVAALFFGVKATVLSHCHRGGDPDRQTRAEKPGHGVDRTPPSSLSTC